MEIKIFLAFVIIAIQSSCSVGQVNCSCEALLKSNGIHNAYAKKTNQSEVLYEIHNDTIIENYFTLVIIQIQDNWAKVSAFSPNKEIKEKGWVQLSRIGILPAEYPVLYNEPDDKSEFKKVKNYNWNYLEILDCKGKWLKVKFENNVGWLPPNNQCANPYTTCN